VPNTAAPRFHIRYKRPGEIEAQDLPAGARILTFRFEDVEDKADKLTLTVDNHDISAFDGDVWNEDNVLEFQFGYPGAMSPPREAVIQRTTGWNPMTVEADAKDAAVMNRLQRTDRIWDDVKRSDVVAEICRSYGYTDAQLHIDDTKLVVAHITQARMTDLQLIRSLAAREGFEFYIDWDGVHFHKRNTKQKPIKTITYFADPNLGDVVSVSLEKDKRAGKPGAVTLQGKDAKTGEPFEVRADNQSTQGERTGLAENLLVHGTEASEIELVDTKTGSTSIASKQAVAASAQELVAPTTETSAAAAQRVANGAYQKQQLRGITLTLGLRGDALLFAKSVVELRAFGTKLSGNWYAKNVTHLLGDNYYSMTAKVSRDGLNGQGVPTAASKNAQEGPNPPGPGNEGSAAQQLGPIDHVDAFGNVTTTYQAGGGSS